MRSVNIALTLFLGNLRHVILHGASLYELDVKAANEGSKRLMEAEWILHIPALTENNRTDMRCVGIR